MLWPMVGQRNAGLLAVGLVAILAAWAVGLFLGADTAPSSSAAAVAPGATPLDLVAAMPAPLDGPRSITSPATAADGVPADRLAGLPVSPTTPGPPEPPDGAELTMAFSGDALWHSPLWARAQQNAGGVGYDFVPMLARIRPIVEAVDLGVCHLETPIAPPGEELSTYPSFGVPAEVVVAIEQAGYDRCSTASNHVFDRGITGIEATIAALGAVGITQAGMARTPEEIGPTVFEVDGFAVSHLSYTEWYNGRRPPAGEVWRSALIDPARIIADATEARRLGAEVVVVSVHWGVEGSHLISAAQRSVAEAITAGGVVDLVVGHGPHVVQPIEQVNGVWVIYSLGNHISNLPVNESWPASTQDGAIVTVAGARQADGTFAFQPPTVHPTWVDKRAGWLVRPAITDFADPAVPAATRDVLWVSLLRSGEHLGEYFP